MNFIIAIQGLLVSIPEIILTTRSNTYLDTFKSESAVESVVKTVPNKTSKSVLSFTGMSTKQSRKKKKVEQKQYSLSKIYSHSII